MKAKAKKGLGIGIAAVLAAATITADALVSHYYPQIQSYMQKFNSSDESSNSAAEVTKDEALTNAYSMGEKIESEGLVLLKNENNTLPLNTDKINLFGYNSYKTVYTDYGSGGHHNEDQNFNFIDGFEFAGLRLNPELTSFYHSTAQKRAAMTGMTVSDADFNIYEETLDEYTDYSATFWQDAKAYSDVAVYVIGRMAGEGGDCPTDTGDLYGGEAGRTYLQLQPAEEELLAKLEDTFDTVIVIINSSNQMNLGFLEEEGVDAAIWAGGPGSTGTIAVGKTLMGEYNPSGRLVDTYAYDVTSAPAYENFGDFTYTNAGLTGDGNGDANNAKYMYYQEGIYVGYRYYETRYIGDDNVYSEEEEAAYQAAVQYPFGYGLSYTTFAWSDPKWTIGEQGGTISVEVTVTNTGDVAGKDVVELYYTPPYTPGGIEKSAVVLGGFAKTGSLDPGKSETVTITMNYDDLASYDYTGAKAYVLEAGDYTLSLRQDAHTVKNDLTDTFTVDSTITYDETPRSTDKVAVTNQFDDVSAGDGNIGTTLPYLSRADWEGTYPSREASTNATASDEVVERLLNDNHGSLIDTSNDPTVEETYTSGQNNGVVLSDASGIYDESNEIWDQLLDHMSLSEMNNLYGNCGWCSPEVSSIGKPLATECDGPNGIHDLASGLEASEYPTETVVAATWNLEIALEEGQAYGDEDLVNGVSGTYGPGLDIHRTAFGGRAAEYYSEDPLLSGLMAANMVMGIQDKGIYVFPKHFALNDQEINRGGVLIWANEQAMREVYLRAFEVLVENVTGEGLNSMGLTGIMESYNRIGTSPAGYRLDTTIQLWHRDRERYQMEKQNIDLINLKYHDLKHIINRLSRTADGRYQEEVEHSAHVFDQIYHTGNEALDVVLTEKAFNCEKNNISFTCIANGDALAHMQDVDIYSLLGNALDNAIEATCKVANPDQRVISCSIGTQGNMSCIHIENSFRGPLVFDNGLPQTSKKDRQYHGYGMKSMKLIVERYGGTMSISTDKEIFLLNIMLAAA